MVKAPMFGICEVLVPNGSGRDLGSFVIEVQANIARQVKLPTGFSIKFGGQFENQERAERILLGTCRHQIVKDLPIGFG